METNQQTETTQTVPVVTLTSIATDSPPAKRGRGRPRGAKDSKPRKKKEAKVAASTFTTGQVTVSGSV